MGKARPYRAFCIALRMGTNLRLRPFIPSEVGTPLWGLGGEAGGIRPRVAQAWIAGPPGRDAAALVYR
jgi:hypothetical protein